MFKILLKLVKFDLQLFFAKRGKIFHPFIFYFIIIFTCPLAINPTVENFKLLSPMIISIAILFAMVISTSQIFEEDYEDGTMEQLQLSGIEPYIIILAKIISHWLIFTLPILITLPAFILMLQLSIDLITSFIVITCLITPIISSIGIFSSALTIGLKNGTALCSIITIPLSISCLILYSQILNNLINNDSLLENLGLIKIIIGLILSMIPLFCYFGGILIKDISNSFK